MIGIYKITSPSKKVYIGQSININKRFYRYKRLECKGQTILYRSFLKYGVGKHKFEILCECQEKELNELERYYQDLYSAMSNNGMNCILTKSSDRSGKLSDETKLKMNAYRFGKLKSKETKDKISKAQIGKRTLGENSNAKIVLDTLNGVFYSSAKEVSILYKIHYGILKNKLNGCKKNNTNFIYV